MFPSTIYVLRQADGTLKIYENEIDIRASTNNYEELATYELVQTEEVKRVVNIVLERNPNVPPKPTGR